MNHAMEALARATEQVDSPTARPAATAEKRHAPWIELAKAGADRIAELIEHALDDDAFDRADSILYLIRRSDDAVLWDEEVFVASLLRTAAIGLTACDTSNDTATALLPATVAMLEELASALHEFHLSNDLGRLRDFAIWSPGSTTIRPANVATPWHAGFDENHVAARSLAHAGSCDIETLCGDMLELANDRLGSAGSDDSAWSARVRMFATRVRALNSLIMSHMDDDSEKLRDAHFVVYGRFPHEGETP